jgi:hypothetical protein
MLRTGDKAWDFSPTNKNARGSKTKRRLFKSSPKFDAPALEWYRSTSSGSEKIFQRKGRKGWHRGTQSGNGFASFANSSASFALNRKALEFDCASATLRLCFLAALR